MRKIKNLFCILACILVVEFALVLCTISGIIKPFNYSDSNSSSGTTTEQNLNNKSDTSYGGSGSNSSGTGGSSNSGSTESGKQPSNLEVSTAVETPLNIVLTGNYLSAYNSAIKYLSNSTSDRNRKLVVKIGLQILQSKTIKYENALHFYSLSYSTSAGTPKAKTYSLKDAINRINAGKTIYTDCFGFVRLAHSIACYSINPSNPSAVSGLSGLYGYKGGYSQASKYSSLGVLNAGTVLYDRLTGSSGDRHVAMFLYSNGNSVVYMDQGGIKTGEFKSSSYIYSTAVKNPYKFNGYKNYC